MQPLIEPLEDRLFASTSPYSVPDRAGNTFSTAANLGSAGKGAKGTISRFDAVTPSDQGDAYKITFTTAANITARVFNLHADADLVIDKNPTGQSGSSTRNGTAAESIIKTLPAGTYYFYIYAATKKVATTYNFSLTYATQKPASSPPPSSGGNSGGSTGGSSSGNNSTGGNSSRPAPKGAVDTYFLDPGGTFNKLGDYSTQQFTVNKTTTFVMRFASDYSADAVIALSSNQSAFTSGSAISAYAAFNRQFGTKTVTLGAGSYFVGVRNESSSANQWRIEVDYAINVSDGRYVGSMFPAGSNTVDANGGKLYQKFTIQSGYRYFIDGDNSGVSSYVIPANQLNNFLNGQTFTYYPDYSSASVDTAQPGLIDLKLNSGDYYLVAVNNTSIPKTYVYTGEIWGLK